MSCKVDSGYVAICRSIASRMAREWLNKFRCLAMAYEALEKGGNMPCIVNAANEIVNRGFLEDKCGFLQMGDIIAETMQRATFDKNPSYDTYIATDAEARRIATELMKG